MEIFPAVAEVFQESQSFTASVKSQAHKLRKLHQAALTANQGPEFTDAFVRCVVQIVPHPRNVEAANLVMKFIRAYFELISPADEDSEAEEVVPWFEFLEAILQVFLDGSRARKAPVRYRCLSIVQILLPLGMWQQDSLNAVKLVSIERSRDTESGVRLVSVFIMAMLDDAPELEAALVERMQYDPVANIRSSAMFNLHHKPELLAKVVERVRDESATSRRILFTKILKGLNMKILSISAREMILRCGLQDRDESVRRVAQRLLVNYWLPQMDNDILVLLRRLDVLTHPDITKLVLTTFFEHRQDILVDKIRFDEQFWQDLTPESVALLRYFVEYCQERAPSFNSLLEQRIPTLSELGINILSRWNELALLPHSELDDSPSTEERQSELQFMVSQLLHVAERSDFSDEEGRRIFSGVFDTLLASPDTVPSEAIVTRLVNIRHRIIDDKDDDRFVLLMLEMLSGVQDSVIEAPGGGSAQAVITALLTCLSAVRATLATTSSVSPTYLTTIMEDFVIPAVASPNGEVRRRGLACMALVCMLNDKFADANFGKLIAPLEDVLADWGVRERAGATRHQHQQLRNREAMLEDGVGERESAIDTEDAKLLMASAIDVLMVHERPEFVSRVEEMWIAFIGGRSRELTASAANGLAKLLLSGQTSSKYVLFELVMLYLNTNVYDRDAQARLQQELNVFLRALVLDGRGRKMLAQIAATVFAKFYGWNTGGRASAISEAMAAFKPTALVGWFVDMTAPDATCPTSGPHVILGDQLIEAMGNMGARASTTQRQVASWLRKLALPKPEEVAASPSLAQDLKRLHAATDKALEMKDYEPIAAQLSEHLEILNELSAQVPGFFEKHFDSDMEDRDTSATSQHSADLSLEDAPVSSSFTTAAVRGGNSPAEIGDESHAGSTPEAVSAESFTDVTAMDVSL